MFLKNPLVFVQFHPVVYMVKLNIEMSMASLIVRLAQGKTEQDMDPEEFHSSTGPTSHADKISKKTRPRDDLTQSFQMTSKAMRSNNGHSRSDSNEGRGEIHCRTDLNVVVEQINMSKEEELEASSSRSSNETPHSMFGDETPLHKFNMKVNTQAV